MKLQIDGVIGYDITSKSFKENLSNDFEDLEVEINSPGGLVFDGLNIFNTVKSHKGHTTAIISGAAMSAASFIAEAFKKIKVYDNSVFMIHNAQGIAVGDQNEVSKMAKYLNKASDIIADIYASRTGKSKSEIKKMMDKETYLFGQEIVDAGFADELIPTTDIKNKDDAILTAMMNYEQAKTQIKPSDILSDMSNFTETKTIPQNTNTETTNRVVNIVNQKEAFKMTVSQIKAEHPDLYKEIYESGKKDAYDNIDAHIAWVEVDKESVLKNIASREDCNMKHISAYSVKAQNKKITADAIAENPVNVETKQEVFESEDDKIKRIVAIADSKLRG